MMDFVTRSIAVTASLAQSTYVPRRRCSRILGRFAAVLGGMIAPVLMLEILLQVGGTIVPGEYQTVDLNATSEEFGRLNMANRAGAKRTSEFSTHVRLNSKGLRGPEIPS